MVILFIQRFSWGRLYASGYPSYLLQKTVFPLIENAICSNVSPGFVQQSTICAGYLSSTGPSPCIGDDGGFLGFESPASSGNWTQTGVLSWYSGCDPALPSGYMNVGRYLKWIKEAISKTMNCPSGYMGTENFTCVPQSTKTAMPKSSQSTFMKTTSRKSLLSQTAGIPVIRGTDTISVGVPDFETSSLGIRTVISSVTQFSTEVALSASTETAASSWKGMTTPTASNPPVANMNPADPSFWNSTMFFYLAIGAAGLLLIVLSVVIVLMIRKCSHKRRYQNGTVQKVTTTELIQPISTSQYRHAMKLIGVTDSTTSFSGSNEVFSVSSNRLYMEPDYFGNPPKSELSSMITKVGSPTTKSKR